MIPTFQGNTADDVWQQIADVFRQSGGYRIQPSRDGDTKEILHAAISISDPRQRWVLSRLPSMNPAFAMAEVVWIMAGRRDLAFVEFWNRQMRGFVGSGPNLHGAYGFRLRQHLGLDQLERAFDALSNEPDTRQVVLQIWDSRIDLPHPNGSPVDKDIPCNVMSIPKVRDGKLEWLQIIRSNDLFLGMPHNLIQFTCLQEIMAGWLGVECGTYNQLSDSLHLYARDEAHIQRSLPVAPLVPNTDSLSLPRKQSQIVWDELALRIDQMIVPTLNQGKLLEISKWDAAPQAYQNILVLLAAEAARRHKWHPLSKELISTCTNPILSASWALWLTRMNAAGSPRKHTG